jgi:hypothetical protein
VRKISNKSLVSQDITLASLSTIPQPVLTQQLYPLHTHIQAPPPTTKHNHAQYASQARHLSSAQTSGHSDSPRLHHQPLSPQHTPTHILSPCLASQAQASPTRGRSCTDLTSIPSAVPTDPHHASPRLHLGPSFLTRHHPPPPTITLHGRSEVSPHRSTASSDIRLFPRPKSSPTPYSPQAPPPTVPVRAHHPSPGRSYLPILAGPRHLQVPPPVPLSDTLPLLPNAKELFSSFLLLSFLFLRLRWQVLPPCRQVPRSRPDSGQPLLQPQPASDHP